MAQIYTIWYEIPACYDPGNHLPAPGI